MWGSIPNCRPADGLSYIEMSRCVPMSPYSFLWLRNTVLVCHVHCSCTSTTPVQSSHPEYPLFLNSCNALPIFSLHAIMPNHQVMHMVIAKICALIYSCNHATSFPLDATIPHHQVMHVVIVVGMDLTVEMGGT